MGIGSGVVFDSDSAQEWDECHLKARFVTAQEQPFQLLETLKWEKSDGFQLLDRHMTRLAKSAAYFGYRFDEGAVMQALNEAVAGQDEPQRLRLTLDSRGAVLVETNVLTPLGVDGQLRYAVSNKMSDADSPFTHHKTTRRAFYDDERARLAALTQCDEVLFLNARGEMTEGSFTNVFVQRDGSDEMLTPPTANGLLAGTLREELLQTGRAHEHILTLADLSAPNRVFFGNSVRGLMQGILVS
jgi:para-aminobenzoate synthetase/4-amino-4-deoxychorismate lyase